MSETGLRVVRGIEVTLHSGGSGEPLVYLHSASGEAASWIAPLEALATRFHVYAPVHPGFPGSRGIERIDHIQDLALHYVDLLNDLELERAHLVGSSLGGWIAAEVASLWPERVATLTLVDSAGLWLDEAPPEEIFGVKGDVLAERLFHDQSNPVAQMLRASVNARPEDLPEEFLVGFFQSTEATARVAWNPYLHNPALAARLDRVTSPALVVWGENDRLIPLAYAKRFRDLLTHAAGGARLVTLPRCGHLPVLEQPEALVREIYAFVEQHPISRR